MTVGKKRAVDASIGCLILFLLTIISNASLAQSIYAGGSGDGFAFNSFSQPDNPLLNIYAGGNHDGFSFSSFAQPDNVLYDIYKGGNNDGFSFSGFAQPDNMLYDIYKGGNDDGFSFSSFAMPDNVLYDIYKGGNDDGFSFSSFVMPDNVLYDIYKGGISDGFSFSSLGGMGTEVPLPIELVSFDAVVEDGVVRLIWVTASELHNDFFQIEKSQDGKEFLPVVRVPGAGTTNQRNIYHAIDENPFRGVSYYRLSQTDFDGTKTYSKIILVQVGDSSDDVIRLYPNPVRQGDIVHMNYYSEVGETIKISLFDPAGMSLSNHEITVNIGWNELSLTPELKKKGIYVIYLQTSKGKKAFKLIVL